ncbi:serine/threonine protein kinase [Singulisphaera sp. GP187]|uniref:serine/threonine-protein kinase n=1 Tax=Singulisphaera sp. GP187 TaxID=1882752 RepID=UPI00092A5C60|nr:serine/threonine-protein kinase [Singulisphaera sp. GP187]SIO59105.1 serine/threonine protein kinase [Singulisphaera sp. GP187]
MIGTTLNQRFSLEKELGRGGMGAVYRATDQILQRSVAIKVLKEQSGDEVNRRIRLEAQILARLLHDHVVRLYDFGEANGTWYLVMEEVDGTSYLRRWRSITLAERLRILAHVADALDYAHHQGVIHRDMKPGNVLLTATDQPKLSDFGLSVMAEQSDESGTIRGTPQYMSPEQASGQRLDYRTDLYSLGVMLYENAAGSIPFTGKSLSVIAQHVNAVPERPRIRNPALSESLETLILQMLAKKPDQRPGSGSEIARRLREEMERELARGTAVTVQLPRTDGERPQSDSANGTITLTETKPDALSPTPAPAPAAAAAAPQLSFAAPMAAPPLAKSMLDSILAEPIMLTADERYLCGHYLAYLLGGSRRKGLLLRRPLDPRNADRARLILGMTSIMLAGNSEESIASAAKLLDERPDVRSSLSPIVVAKYLLSRNSPAKTKKFRQARKQLLEASKYAREHMTDDKGRLNPGLIPAVLSDLQKVAPERTEVDDELVERWNRVAEVWRDDAKFRTAVLRYATRNAANDPASLELWPEVVYPLIERVRWQRQTRTKAEAIWDNVCAHLLHVPDAGVRLDRAFEKAVPARVVEQLDAELDSFEDDPQLDADFGPSDSQASNADRLTAHSKHGSINLEALVDDPGPGEKGIVGLANPDPYRFTLGDLGSLWQEAIAALRSPNKNKPAHRLVPVGPYRLVVIPSVRGRSAGQVAIQGMPNKQIEMLTPSIRMGGSGSKPVIAVWIYRDNSLAAVYLDFKKSENYILWHAPNSQQFNFDDPGELNHMLYNLGMEIPDQLDRVLSRWFKPKKPV